MIKQTSTKQYRPRQESIKNSVRLFTVETLGVVVGFWRTSSRAAECPEEFRELSLEWIKRVIDRLRKKRFPSLYLKGVIFHGVTILIFLVWCGLAVYSHFVINDPGKLWIWIFTINVYKKINWYRKQVIHLFYKLRTGKFARGLVFGAVYSIFKWTKSTQREIV